MSASTYSFLFRSSALLREGTSQYCTTPKEGLRTVPLLEQLRSELLKRKIDPLSFNLPFGNSTDKTGASVSKLDKRPSLPPELVSISLVYKQTSQQNENYEHGVLES